jgi:hypothetical protein
VCDSERLDIFTGIYETKGYENEEFNPENPPPPPVHIRIFSAVYAVATKSKFLRKLAELAKLTGCFPGTWTSAHVRRLIRANYSAEYTEDKIAFIVSASAVSLLHLENIFFLLAPHEYDIVFIGPMSESACMEKRYDKKYNCAVLSINEVVKRKFRYKLAVTISGDETTSYGKRLLGLQFIADKILLITSIFMHIHITDFLENFEYDYVVFSGEFQKQRYEKLVRKGKMFVMGSPRMIMRGDDYDSKDGIKTVYEGIAEQTGDCINTDKKTILLLPSYVGDKRIILDFLHLIKKLQDEYNIIIKPHQDMAEEILHPVLSVVPQAIFLKKFDNVKLFPAANFVICDNGNSVLTTIRADKNIILFNAVRDDAEEKPELRDPVYSYLREKIINFYPDEEEKFFAALKDGDIWEKQKEIRRQIRADFFTENPNPARDIAGLCRRIVKGEV